MNIILNKRGRNEKENEGLSFSPVSTPFLLSAMSHTHRHTHTNPVCPVNFDRLSVCACVCPLTVFNVFCVCGDMYPSNVCIQKLACNAVDFENCSKARMFSTPPSLAPTLAFLFAHSPPLGYLYNQSHSHYLMSKPKRGFVAKELFIFHECCKN